MLVYDDPGTFVAGVGAFARAGLQAGDHVVAIVAPEKFAWLREHLGDDAAALEHADAQPFYERHGPMFRAMVGLLERYGTPGYGRVRIAAEQALARRAPADVRAYMRFEAAANVALSGYDASVLCPYDAGRLPEQTIDAALRTHPAVSEHGGTHSSPAFMDPRAFVRQHVHQRAAPRTTPVCPIQGAGDIAAARELVRTRAGAAGLAADAVEDLALAVTEIATNALLHGAHPRLLWSYVEDADLVCQVGDGGPGPADPLAGYLPPDDDRLGGRGLWIAHQLCDIVEIASHPTHTDVYVHMRLPAA